MVNDENNNGISHALAILNQNSENFSGCFVILVTTVDLTDLL